MFRFSLRGLVCFTSLIAIAVAICSYGMLAESEDERDIRLYGELPIEDPVSLFSKVDQLVEAGIRERPWNQTQFATSRPRLTRVELAQVANHYRKAYSFVSLRNRLSYEANSTPRPVKLMDSTLERLSLAEDPTRGGMVKSELPPIRTLALQALHSDWVFHFIRQEGVGMTRMPDPSVWDLESKTWPEIPFEATTEQAPGQATELPDTEPDNPSDKLFQRWTDAKNPLRLPSRPRLLQYFEEDYRDFGRSGRNGFAKDVDHVAGFLPHRITSQRRIRMDQVQLPQGREPDASPNDWGVKSLHLVSLLKHDRPQVYVSKSLPNMESLPEANLRDLDGFETMALERLYNGDDLCIQARENQVRMLGSLRAMKQCLDCHLVERGELLGAFSYEFARLTPDAETPIVETQ